MGELESSYIDLNPYAERMGKSKGQTQWRSAVTLYNTKEVIVHIGII